MEDRRDPWIGRTLAGKYRVEEPIGAGSAGRLYRARDLAGGAEVALELLAAGETSEPASTRRFEQVTQAIRRLEHPNNVALLDSGVTEEGRLYLVTRMVRGRTLEAIIRDEAPLQPRRVVQLLTQALDGLAEAHEAGIVHRDFQPARVFVEQAHDGSEHVKVTGYGIARPRGGRDPGDAACAPGDGASDCEHDYSAPEQIRGEPADERSDVYAAGVVLYELLTASRPFRGPATDVRALHLHGPPEPPRLRRLDLAIPPALERVCLRALEKAPGRRIQSAARMRDELAQSLPAEAPARSLPLPPDVGDAARWPMSFVGRQAALERLLALRRGAVLVVGAPGSGRSRLIDEWRRRVVEQGERVIVMRADPRGARGSWQPVRRALAAVLGIPERPADEQLRSAIRERATDAVGLGVVFDFGGDVSAAPSEEERTFRRREALAAAAGLLREAAVALVCEDVDRYDRPSVELVRALMADAGLSRLVVTSTGRGDLPEVETVTLAPFGPAELEALGVDPASLEIPVGAPVTPLAVEQSLRAALEGAPDASARGRLDALLPAARRVLAAAVVAGTEVDAPALQRLTATSDVLAPVSSLVSRGIARYEDGRVVLPSPTQRDAFYAALEDEERRALHRALADLLAARDEEAVVIADHAFAGAPDAAPPDLLDLLERAMKAADRAFDDAGVVRWGIRALRQESRGDAAEARGEPPARHRIALALGDALLRIGSAAHAESAFGEALSSAAGVPQAEARAHRGLARVALADGSPQTAEAALLRAIEGAGADPALAGELHLELAALRDGLGRERDAETALIQGVVKAPEAPGVTWRLLLGLAERNHAAGRSADALKIASQALAAAADGQLAHARIHGLLAVVQQALGDVPAAAAHRRSALAALRRLGDRRSMAEMLLGCALAEPPGEATPRRWLAEAGELARQVGWAEGVARAQEALRELG